MNSHCKGLRPHRVSLVIVLVPFLSGCATMIHEVHHNVRIETDPPGATASVGEQKVTTPGVLKLKRKEKALEIVVEK